MNYSPEQLAQFPWIVSSGTLRPQDLLNANVEALEQLERIRPGVKLEPSGQTLREFLDCVESAATVAKCLDGHWSEPCADIPPSALERIDAAIEDTAEALEHLAPAGFYFGASEGDGACIGFWLEQDWANALDERGLASELEQPEHVARFIEAAEDYGLEPGTLCDGYCGWVEGYTASQAGAEYAAQLADECGMVPDAWPLRHIDWEAAWRELELSDSYGASPSLRSGEWWIFRSV